LAEERLDYGRELLNLYDSMARKMLARPDSKVYDQLAYLVQDWQQAEYWGVPIGMLAVVREVFRWLCDEDPGMHRRLVHQFLNGEDPAFWDVDHMPSSGGGGTTPTFWRPGEEDLRELEAYYTDPTTPAKVRALQMAGVPTGGGGSAHSPSSRNADGHSQEGEDHEPRYTSFESLLEAIWQANQQGLALYGLDLRRYPTRYGPLAIYFFLRDLEAHASEIPVDPRVQLVGRGPQTVPRLLNRIMGALHISSP
jgi:hypothetical protein